MNLKKKYWNLKKIKLRGIYYKLMIIKIYYLNNINL